MGDGGNTPDRSISASDVANYVVCPQAWFLKFSGTGARKITDRAVKGRQAREEWVSRTEMSAQLRHYAKIVYLLLLALTVGVFLVAELGRYFALPTIGITSSGPERSYEKLFANVNQLLDASGRRNFAEICTLLLVLGLVIFIWDLFDRRSRVAHKETGLDERVQMVAVHGSTFLPSRYYYSESEHLSSKPNALVREEGALIPVDIQPMSDKVKDRHVIQLLMHMRLMAEVDGKVPPHGILLMGEKKRVVKIKNTDEKQRWLQSVLEEMWSIMDGVPPMPTPAVQKCRHCDVRELCQHTAYKPRQSAPPTRLPVLKPDRA